MIARWIERGLSVADARRRAMRELGGIERTKEEVRSETGVRLIQDCAQDLRYAVRMLRRAGGIAHLLGREWLAVVGAGVVLGVLASLVSTRVLASLLHGIGPVDPAVLAVTTVTIVGAALLACVAPVRTALRWTRPGR